MTEHMYYATYGRTRRRPTRRVACDKHQIQNPSPSQHQQCQKMCKRRSDPDGAYCVSSEEHSNNVKDTRRSNISGDTQRMSGSEEVKSYPPSAASRKNKSSSDAKSTRSSSPVNRSTQTSSNKLHSSSTRPSRSSNETFHQKKLRSSSLKSCKSTKSSKTSKSDAPTLTSELTCFDLKMSNQVAMKQNIGTKNFLLNKISSLSILGGCKKKPSHRRRPVSRSARTRCADSVVPRKSRRARQYQPEDGSCTYLSEEDMSSSESSSYSSESESEFNSSYESFSISDSSTSSDEYFEIIKESKQMETHNVLRKNSNRTFVKDGFDTDDDISGAEDLHDSVDSICPSVSTKSKVLIQTLEAENAALRASVVALRSDWEDIVKKMSCLQLSDGALSDKETYKSPNLQAVRDLRDLATYALNQKRTQDVVERKKRESNLKSCIECVEELLCENERLYDNILKLSQEREGIMKELNSLRNQTVKNLEESHHSLLAEDNAKAKQVYIDDLSALITKAKKDLSEDENNIDDMGNKIMQLLLRVKSQRTDMKHKRHNSLVHVTSRENSRRKFKYSTSRARRRNGTKSNEAEDCSATKRRSSAFSGDSSRRSSYYSNSTGCQSSMYSESSRSFESDSDYSANSEIEHDEKRGETNIIESSMISLFDHRGPSFSSKQDGDHDSSPDLDVIYEKFDDSYSESEYSSESSSSDLYIDYIPPSPMSSKKKSWYNAVRSVATRIRKNDRHHTSNTYHVAKDDSVTEKSRRSSDNTLLSDVELTHYPNISRKHSPPSSSRSSNSKSSSRSMSRDSRQLASSFSTIKEDKEVSFSESTFQCFHATEQENDDVSNDCNISERLEYNNSNFSTSAPIPQNENDAHTQEVQTSYTKQSPGNIPNDLTSIGASVSHCDGEFDNTSVAASCATSSSESTKERKGISITVVTRSSRFLTLPSSRSHTYMTFFTASLLKNQIDDVLHEQYCESMKNITSSMSSMVTDATKQKNRKYKGDLNDDGERHGYGIYKSKNGNEYRGEWQYNEREGLGVVRIGNGDVFEGQFEHNMKNGVGVYHYIDGECDLSRYTDDRRVGNSLRYTKDRKKAFLLSEDFSSKEISIDNAAMEARAMGVVVQL